MPLVVPGCDDLPMADDDGFTIKVEAVVTAAVTCSNPQCQVEGCPVHDEAVSE